MTFVPPVEAELTLTTAVVVNVTSPRGDDNECHVFHRGRLVSQARTGARPVSQARTRDADRGPPGARGPYAPSRSRWASGNASSFFSV